MLGFTCLALAFLFTCIAFYYYFRGKLRYGNVYYWLTALAVIIAAVYLLCLILTDNFNYAYVYGYSSHDLILPYKISVFWAGQEGSFLFWLAVHAIIGVLMLRRADTPARTMGFYCVLQALLLAFLIMKSPFRLLPVAQSEGMGLNPLLRDPWMVIHPPLVFIGYAALAVPLAYALQALASNKHQSWLNNALSWLLWAWMFLGAGIFVGGFWAYKVLGWGGYWAWDPVENSSLVPWLLAGAALHAILLARKRADAVKYAYGAVIASYIAVLYGTFLTRSGVLSNFSTHSFADEGIGGLLAAGLIVIFAASFLLLIWRWPQLPQIKAATNHTGRDVQFLITVGLLAAFAAVVFIGMSMPLFTLAFGKPQSVNTVYYNRAVLPLAAGLMILLSVGLVRGQYSRKVYQAGWMASLVMMFAGYRLGLMQALLAGTFGFAAAALVINLLLAYRRQLSRTAGVTHAGAALLVMGILVSSAASQTTLVSLTPAVSYPLFNTTVTYQGEQNNMASGERIRQFIIGDKQSPIVATTKIDASGRVVHQPAIYRGLFADIYLAANDMADEDFSDEVKFTKGETKAVNGLTVKFLRLNVSGAMGGVMHIQAVLEVTADGKLEQALPGLNYGQREITSQPVTIGDKYEVRLTSVYPGSGNIGITIRELGTLVRGPAIKAEVSHKPLINLVWMGALMIMYGTGWAAVTRLRQLAANAAVAELDKAKRHKVTLP